MPDPSPSAATSRQALERLLAERNEHPENLADIDRRIWEAFGARRALWVLDMCGFSRLTMRHGVTHFLAMIQRLHALVHPIVTAERGIVVKTEADNVFASFAEVGDAITAARKVHERLRSANTILPEDWDLHASIGIGYGEVLLVGDDDFYGHELNIASKLGEDVAGPGEIFVSDAAYQQAEASGLRVAADRQEIPIATMRLVAYRLHQH